MTIEERVAMLKTAIEKACCIVGLNLTVYDGRIGFVDQGQEKIVALWTPEYTAGGKADADMGRQDNCDTNADHI